MLLLASCVGPSTAELNAVAHQSSSGQKVCDGRSTHSALTPTVCHGPHGTHVIGLGAYHAWTRGTRVLVTQLDEILGERTVGVGWVVEQNDTSAKINLIFQEPNMPLEGGKAIPLGGDRHPRFEKYFARLDLK
jgi:hypothetical protein